MLDPGCGTGHLAHPLAAKAGAVIGKDPSADMLAHARSDTGAANVTWVLGSDEQVPALEPLLGREGLDLVTVGTALHWMDPSPLFGALARLLRPGGGIAVVANGTPVWLHETAWARALTGAAAAWFDNLNFPTCGTSEDERARYADLLKTAGFFVEERRFDYAEVLGLEEVIGSFYSAAPLKRLTGERRARFDADLRSALLAAQPDGRFVEAVPVHALLGRTSHKMST